MLLCEHHSDLVVAL